MTALIAFTGYSIAFKLTKDLSWTAALLIGAAGAAVVFLAVFVGLTLRRRDLRAVGADELSPRQQLKAYRAVQRGRLDPDPALREVTLRIADRRLKGFQRHRLLVIITAALLAVSAVLSILDGRMVGAAITLAGAAGAVGLLVQARILKKRAAQLLAAATGAGWDWVGGSA
ncbi:hypothetical protein [Kribbella sp. NPDC051770]|uniref:hypothetical protein n=1 Tax=Kribbella sp. NPDC051770 TaxID=3155413 RepID=UPI00341F7075